MAAGIIEKGDERVYVVVELSVEGDKYVLEFKDIGIRAVINKAEFAEMIANIIRGDVKWKN